MNENKKKQELYNEFQAKIKVYENFVINAVKNFANVDKSYWTFFIKISNLGTYNSTKMPCPINSSSIQILHMLESNVSPRQDKNVY